ncbi:unnamed protein product [Protopolystoma xenopodis]|uniref:Uncharacterized protein n=1 Tax=Protopolystoma xenopodis TaxID=117903 RepID=A0A3S5A2U0_9PLAT|nr:unnamed protein product [Protopolystoma xenopodis]
MINLFSSVYRLAVFFFLTPATSQPSGTPCAIDSGAPYHSNLLPTPNQEFNQPGSFILADNFFYSGSTNTNTSSSTSITTSTTTGLYAGNIIRKSSIDAVTSRYRMQAIASHEVSRSSRTSSNLCQQVSLKPEYTSPLQTHCLSLHHKNQQLFQLTDHSNRHQQQQQPQQNSREVITSQASLITPLSSQSEITYSKASLQPSSDAHSLQFQLPNYQQLQQNNFVSAHRPPLPCLTGLTPVNTATCISCPIRKFGRVSPFVLLFTFYFLHSRYK